MVCTRILCAHARTGRVAREGALMGDPSIVVHTVSHYLLRCTTLVCHAISCVGNAAWLETLLASQPVVSPLNPFASKVNDSTVTRLAN